MWAGARRRTSAGRGAIPVPRPQGLPAGWRVRREASRVAPPGSLRPRRSPPRPGREAPLLSVRRLWRPYRVTLPGEDRRVDPRFRQPGLQREL